MQTLPTILSPWARLKKGEITCEEALRILVDKQGIVNLDLLDSEVSSRFFREVPNRSALPPVIPLLLWRNCYYLGSPVSLPRENIQKLSASTLTAIKIIPIADKSYRAWYLTRSFNANSISAASLVNPITGETEPEDISEVTELYLKKVLIQYSVLDNYRRPGQHREELSGNKRIPITSRDLDFAHISHVNLYPSSVTLRKLLPFLNSRAFIYEAIAYGTSSR